jgi:transketolase
MVACEDHSYLGGLTSATALALRCSATPLDYVAVADLFGQSAHNIDELLTEYGLTPEIIAQKAIALLASSTK